MNRRRTTKLSPNRNQRLEELITRRDYRRLLGNVLENMFPDLQQRAQAVELLGDYTDDRPETLRVRLAVLKLSETDLTKIGQNIQGAIEDYEDTVLWAESPRQMRCAIGNKKLTQKEQDQVSTEDREEFEKWLRTF